MLKGDIKDGQTVVVDFDAKQGKLTFTAKPVEEPVFSKAS